MNPYNCTKPGNLFVGYDRLLQQLLNGLRDGNSFALIGGRRCGKTSLLLQLQKELEQTAPQPLRFLPRYLDIQELDQRTCQNLFEQVYSLTVREIVTESQQSMNSEKPYQSFLKAMDQAKPLLNEKYGADWVIVLLVDELDVAVHSLPNDQFFQNLRNLLMISRFHRHFRLVASGVNNLEQLISSGSSPLNNLRAKYLSILKIKPARQLLNAGFPDGFDEDLEPELFRMTGRHPYLLQGLLEYLWNNQNHWDKKYLKSYVQEFLKDHNTFDNWLKKFRPTEHAVYQILAKAPDGRMHVKEIKMKLEAALQPQWESALQTLSYHGVIDDSDPDEPEIAGTIFRDWYWDKMPVSKDTNPAHSKGSEKATDPPNTPIYIVNQAYGGSIHSGMSAEDALQIFKELQTLIHCLNIEERAKKQALNAVEQGKIELEHPKPDKEPDKDSINTALKTTTDILKSAEGSAGALEKFIQRTQRLAPYLGQLADWLP